MEYIGKLKCLTSAEISSDSRIGIGFECLDRELFDPNRCYDLLGASGIKYARCQTGWNRCEKEKGVYDFSWLDDIVDNLKKRGMIPWFNVGFGNPVYMDNCPTDSGVGCVPLYYGEETLTAWKNFVHALAVHFKGRVTYYEIWNEADISPFWFPETPDGKEYARLVNLTGEIIRKADTDAKIGACVSGSLAYQWTVRPFMYDFVSHVGLLDFFCHHEYLIAPDRYTTPCVRQLRALLDTFGHKDCEIWNGECGYPSWFPADHTMQPRTSGSERQQAVGHLRYLFNDTEAGSVRTSIFQTVDMLQKTYTTATLVRKNPARQGILNGITYTPKLTYSTLRRMATIMNGKVTCSDAFFVPFVGKNPEDDHSIRSFALECNGKLFYAYYAPYDTEAETPTKPDAVKPLVDALHNRAFENPVLVDVMDGSVYRLSYAYDRGYFKGLSPVPLADYPLIICDISMITME